MQVDADVADDDDPMDNAAAAAVLGWSRQDQGARDTEALDRERRLDGLA